MRRLLWISVGVFGLLAAGGGCERRPKVVLPLGEGPLRSVTAEDADVLLRYLRASPRWEVREERGVRVAYRRERNGGAGDEVALPGGFRTSLNGYYSDFRAQDLRQGRVALWFGTPPSAGSRREIVEVDARAQEVTLRPNVRKGEEVATTWLRVKAAHADLVLEVMEQAASPERRFTRAALGQIAAELSRALDAREALSRDGYVESLWPGGEPERGPARLGVADGMQPGIYVVTGFVNPGADGEVFVRVRQAGVMPTSGAALAEVKAGAVLSEQRARPRTTRLIGWSATDPDVLFPYQSLVTVYEGDWEEDYGARFELVFVPSAADGGGERVLASHDRVINGWMR